MKPRSLSATAAQVYELCPARYRAEQIDRAPGVGSWAAGLGTVCHTALENWVKNGHHTAGDDFEVLQSIYENAYYDVFSEPSEYLNGVALLRVWHARQDWSGRTVVSVEDRNSFDLPSPDGKIRFNYVMDRVDRLDNGEIEVVDYKTSGFPIQPDELRHKIQARAYALAAQLEHPDAPRVWVTFDMLRFDPVGVVFTQDQNRETWRYLKRLVERIWEDDKAPEVLNAECRWCIRRHECKQLKRHVNGGGPLTLDDPLEAVDLRAELFHAKAAIEVLLRDVDAFLLEHCEREDLLEIETEQNVLNVSLGSRRYVNPEQVAKIVGPELLARYGNINVSAIDEMLKSNELSDEQKSQLRQSIGRKTGNPSIKTSKRMS